MHAVAISPKGKNIVVGGFTGLTWFGSAELYVFDRLTGAWRGSIGFGQSGAAAVRDLAFLPDNRLVVALDDRKSLHVVDFAAERISIVADDLDDAVLSLDVAADGRLVAAARDGSVRLYDATLRRVAKVQMPTGLQPFKVAFDPQASLVAIGLTGGPDPKVMLLNADGLKQEKEFSGGGKKQRGALAARRFTAPALTAVRGASASFGDGRSGIRGLPSISPWA